MKHPTLLKGMVTYDQAMETIMYLYSTECVIQGDGNKIRGYYNGDQVINYNKEYGNIMISQDFVEQIRRDQA